MVSLKYYFYGMFVLYLTCRLVSASSSSDYDLDGNGTDNALTDELLMLRHQFGLSGGALITGALAPNTTKTFRDRKLMPELSVAQDQM